MGVAVNPYSIGTPGQAWGAAEIALWRSRQMRQRSYADEVLSAVDGLRERFDISSYGEVVYAQERFALMAVRSRDWQEHAPIALITGGVHGYETSGVQGALQFMALHGAAYAKKVNLLVVPCVSPWAYERVQRWNFDAIDPNRAFREGSTAQEAAALMRLVEPLRDQIALHMDLHETTRSDETEFRPMLAARDGKAFEPGHIPDGFYLVADAARPRQDFQQAILISVSRVTHIAPPDAKGEIIGSPQIAPGVIAYDMQPLGLCAGITDAPLVTTTEVYPDSALTTPAQCTQAQVAAVCAGLDFLVENSSQNA